MANKDLVITILMIYLILSIGIGLNKAINPSKGSPCAVEVKYANSKATYVGYSL